ncbi:MAG: AraC family transcriptional regulator [Polaromonas sp.]|uniref:AraC family transcriptional regulator n=1 Tax=Polaromonas sp. TaxID=1869339 RepID=UPI0025F90392|nr:AraC family transcriptional regulator [Polaromonas sp.]MBI2726546.1 AraC family transcriptional regulator [Polaromonas sp.]
MEALKEAIVRYANCYADASGLATTSIPGVRMMCARRPSEPIRSLYTPLVCLVLQGTKQLHIGKAVRTVFAGESVIVGVDAPVTGTVVQATADQPYLALALDLDFAVMRELMTELPDGGGESANTSRTVFVGDSDVATLDCGLRMMRLLDQPDSIPVLRSGIFRELHYWLLSGRHGSGLRGLALPDSNAQRVAVAIQMLRDRFQQTILVDELAEAARMSTSVFHRRFKTITSLTPIQFQKQLRLMEARRLMLNEGRAANYVAYEVGYESVSQFSREYARMFGAPPRRDTRAERFISRSSPRGLIAAMA